MTFPVFGSFSVLGKRRETETSLTTRTRMVDYEVRDLETRVLVESDDGCCADDCSLVIADTLFLCCEGR